jgi:hypothetical protein
MCKSHMQIRSYELTFHKAQRSTRNRKSATKIVSADDSDEDLNSLSDGNSITRCICKQSRKLNVYAQ